MNWKYVSEEIMQNAAQKDRARGKYEKQVKGDGE